MGPKIDVTERDSKNSNFLCASKQGVILQPKRQIVQREKLIFRELKCYLGRQRRHRGKLIFRELKCYPRRSTTLSDNWRVPYRTRQRWTRQETTSSAGFAEVGPDDHDDCLIGNLDHWMHLKLLRLPCAGPGETTNARHLEGVVQSNCCSVLNNASRLGSGDSEQLRDPNQTHGVYISVSKTFNIVCFELVSVSSISVSSIWNFSPRT
jgi:hypothetical protein